MSKGKHPRQSSFMAQGVDIRFGTLTNSKMFAKKMHRLVKKIQDKPVDSLEALSDMARKKGENLSIPIEVETEAQWTALLKREGLIVVDVFSGWSGPCTSMFSILRKLKLDSNDDRMIMAAANADNIKQLSPFRNQSEPCWLFIGGGKPVKVLRGSNAPHLVRTIKSEFQHELECIEGTGKRNLISIKFEASRREKAVSEAIALDELITLEEEEKRVKVKEKSKSPTPPPQENENEDGVPEQEALPEVPLETEDDNEKEDGSGDEKETEDPEASAIDEATLERRKLMEESNNRLKDALRCYTVLVIQSYLIQTGAVTEIKDHIAENFNLVRERCITLNDEDARNLFGIPTEIPDNSSSTNRSDHHSDTDDVDIKDGDENEAGPEAGVEANSNEPQNKDEPDEESVEKDEEESESGDDVDENGERRVRRKRREKTPIRMIPVPIPDVIIGDTLILLLECTRVKPVKRRGDFSQGSSDEGQPEDEDPLDADYYIKERTGPEDYESALETKPESLHALYGTEKHVAGVWCPRTYEEKRFVVLNYFPLFVTEMLMPPIPDPPKYHIYVFSALFSSEILEHPEFVKGRKYVVAERRMRIPHSMAEKMLIASKRTGDFLRALRWALTGTEVLVVSANGRNRDLIQILKCFDPIFSTSDIIEAGYFTAKLFPDVEVLMDDEPFAPVEIVAPCNLANLVGKLTEGLDAAKRDENGSDTNGDKSNVSKSPQ